MIARPVGPCDVEWFERRGGAIILACPHTDLIRLWPLPVEQPWWEHSPFSESVALRDGPKTFSVRQVDWMHP